MTDRDRRRRAPPRRHRRRQDPDPDRGRPRALPRGHRQHPRPASASSTSSARPPTAAPAIEMAGAVSPSIVLMDLSLPAPGGLETTQRIRREFPAIAVIVMAQDEDEESLFASIKAGAAAFVIKDISPEDLIHVIRRVVAGRVPDQRQGLLQAGRRVARPQGVPRAGRLRPGGPADLRAAVAARGGDPRQHRPGHDQQAGRLRPVDQRADRQEPHELDPPEARRERPDPGRRVRDAPGLDQDAGGLRSPRDAGAAAASRWRKRRPTGRSPRPRISLRASTEEADAVRREVDEIELLINQAKTEAEPPRGAAHRRRGQARDGRGAARRRRAASPPKELTELANQLVAVARRAALMEAQMDLLEGKRKSAARLHEAIVEHAAQARILAGLPDGGRSGARAQRWRRRQAAGADDQARASRRAARCRPASRG